MEELRPLSWVSELYMVHDTGAMGELRPLCWAIYGVSEVALAEFLSTKYLGGNCPAVMLTSAPV